MPSMKMITVGEAGGERFGPASAADGFSAVAQLDSWSPEALAPHIQGYYHAQAQANASHSRRINEVARLLGDCVLGRVESIFFREAMNPRNPVLVDWLRQAYPGIYKVNGRELGLRETMVQTDYQALFADVIDRLFYGMLKAWPITNMPLVKQVDLRDFRQVKRYMLDGLVTPFIGSDPGAPPPQSALLGPTPQMGTSPPTPATSTAAVTYAPWLFQAGASINWAAFVNDDLGIFRYLANRLAIAGTRGISKFITSFYVDANGPNALLYTTGYKNKIVTANGAASNNPVLGVQGISDALKVLAAQRDSGGDPIQITGRLRLWFGPSLLVTANNVMNQLSVFLQNEGGGTNAQGFPVQLLQVNNWLIQNMDLVMDPYIPIVCTTGGVQNTMWGITVDPDSQNRPNTEIGFLNGTEIPIIERAEADFNRLGISFRTFLDYGVSMGEPRSTQMQTV